MKCRMKSREVDGGTWNCSQNKGNCIEEMATGEYHRSKRRVFEMKRAAGHEVRKTIAKMLNGASWMNHCRVTMLTTNCKGSSGLAYNLQ